MISAQTPCVCREGKPLHTFPDHASGQQRRPGRIGSVARRPHALLVAAGDVDGEQPRSAGAAGVAVRRVADLQGKANTNRLDLAPCCVLMTMGWPSGEKRGANDMAGKLPTISRWPVSMLKR